MTLAEILQDLGYTSLQIIIILGVISAILWAFRGVFGEWIKGLFASSLEDKKLANSKDLATLSSKLGKAVGERLEGVRKENAKDIEKLRDALSLAQHVSRRLLKLSSVSISRYGLNCVLSIGVYTD